MNSLNREKKLTIILLLTGFLVGSVGQILWAVIFFNNPEQFGNHWGVALLGIGIACLAIIPVTINLIKSL